VRLSVAVETNVRAAHRFRGGGAWFNWNAQPFVHLRTKFLALLPHRDHKRERIPVFGTAADRFKLRSCWPPVQ